MKLLQRGLVASAAGLLLTAGLALPAAAAPSDCAVSIADPAPQSEGDTGIGNTMTFRVTITDPEGGGTCTGGSVTYTTANGSAKADEDYAAQTDTLEFAGPTPSSSPGSRIVITLLPDDVFEPEETFTVTLRPVSGEVITRATATGTIQNDDTIGASGTATIDPASGPTGTTITVTGTQCNAANGGAQLIQTKGESGGPIASDLANTVGSNGTFTATLQVPGDADPAATQFVRAFCGSEPASGNDYDDVSFDVTTGARGGDGTDTGNGYRMVAGDGGIFTFGDRQFHGSTGDTRLNKPIVGGATDLSDYEGYWIVASDGGVFAFGAEFHGSLGGANITSPAVEIEPTQSGKGYWIVQADGTVTAFGDARHHGDMKGRPLNGAIIGMAVTPTGLGYWLVGSDGGIFNFGDAEFFGSTGDRKLNAPIVDLAATADNKGYYLLGRDGGVFTFGSAEFKGSTGDLTLNAPVIAMLVAPTGAGYWLAASDGGVFTFGAVEFLGSMGGTKLNSPVLDLIN